MASDKISIDQETLEESIKKLDTLIGDERLTNLLSEIQGAIETSSGGVADYEVQAGNLLGDLQANRARLFERTKEYLISTVEVFDNADKKYGKSSNRHGIVPD